MANRIAAFGVCLAANRRMDKKAVELANLKFLGVGAKADRRGGLIGTMVSDAFFPFRDEVDAGLKEGLSAIVQPGGSDRDFESITACNEANPKVTMVFTGQRVFVH